jgi:hypothetical protein
MRADRKNNLSPKPRNMLKKHLVLVEEEEIQISIPEIAFSITMFIPSFVEIRQLVQKLSECDGTTTYVKYVNV